MTRPALEVADLLHKQGDRFMDQSPWLSYQQLSVLRAITCCRTAARGGHINQCSQCGHQAISYNSCLMGSNSLWRVQRRKGMLHAASRPFDSPLRFTLQQREQFVGRPKLALAKARRYDRFDSLKLFCGIGSNVDFRRGQIAVSQP